MVTVYVRFKLKDGSTREEERKFNTCYIALRFMYRIKRLNHSILGWKCDYAEDNEYLSKRFRIWGR